MTGTRGESFPDALLASSVNNGGMFLVVDGVAERISPVDTTGIAVEPDGYLWARQAEGVAELRRIRGALLEPVVLTRESLDLHDIHRHQDRLYVVATETNTVYEMDAATFAESRRWVLPGERDSQHLNSVCVHGGRILVSRFGCSALHRGYKGQTRGAGQVVDIETGEVVIDGLSQPHSLRSYDGRLWLCSSEAHAVCVYRDFVLEREIAVGGYARGLAFGADHVYVGISRSRNEAQASASEAGIAAFALGDLAARGRMVFPADEVYDLVVVGDGIDALRRAGLQDTFNEVDGMRHSRNLFAIQYHQQLARVAGLDAELQAATAEIRACATRADIARVAARDAQDRAAETDIWVDLQQRAIDGLQVQVGQLRAACHAADARRAQAMVVLGAIDDSRSWRWTRVLRSSASHSAVALLPADADAERGMREDDLAAPALPTRAMLPIVGLAFVEHAEPRVSIVVAAYGQFAQTLACLQSIQRAGDATTFEVILVEDQSPDPDMARFAHVPGLRYVANPENVGYLRSVNHAATLARGTWLHLLNNDTQVASGWLDALVSTFALFHRCGMAGSKLVYPDGTLQEAGGIVWSDGDACNYGRGDDPSRTAYAVVREVDYVSGASLLLPTALFAELGGFDERYRPAYYEDTDLAFRIREAGHKVYVQPGSLVVHHEGLSHGTDTGAGVNAGQPRNRDVFHARWQHELARGQLAPGEHVFLARDRAQLGQVVLVVDRHPPQPDRDAGSRAIWQLMRVLYLQGFTVKFWAQDAGADSAYAASLRLHGIELFDDAADGPFDDWMQAHGRYIDHVVLSRPMVAECHLDAVRRHSDATVTFYGHDIHHLRIGRHAELEDDVELRAQAAHLLEVEKGLWSGVDLVLYPSDEETAEVQAWLESTGAPAVAKTVPLYAFETVPTLEDASGTPVPERDLLLFVGGFSHAPNADAVLWFAREVWPLVSARHPGLRLCLAGGDADAGIHALAGPTVEVTGFLPEHELHARYRRARVALAPLRFGAGTKGKVIEAMWHGVPCVTTFTGRQGLADADALRVADEPIAMADAITALVEDAEAWWQASRAGQVYVAEHFTVQAVWDALAGLFGTRPAPESVSDRRHRLDAAAARHDEVDAVAGSARD